MDFEKEIEEMPEDVLDAANKKLVELFDKHMQPSNYPMDELIALAIKIKNML